MEITNRFNKLTDRERFVLATSATITCEQLEATDNGTRRRGSLWLELCELVAELEGEPSLPIPCLNPTTVREH